MALIADAVAQGIIDRIGYIRKYITAAVTGGTAFYARVTGTDDSDVELTMGQAAYDTDELLEALQANLEQLWDALTLHLARISDTKLAAASYASIDAWLTAETWRVPIQLSDLAFEKTGAYLTAANVYDDVKVQGTFEISGDGAGEWVDTDAEAIDAVHTSGNNLEAYVPAGSVATDVDITVVCILPDETTESKAITVNIAADDATRVVAIGDAGDRYIGVNTVTIQDGGLNGEAIIIRSKGDRPLAL